MKLFRITTKRGLGTVVTAMILLTAVAMMGIFVVDWSRTNLAVHQEKLESTFASNLNKLNERVILLTPRHQTIL